MKALGASYSNFFLSRQREKERVALCFTDFALSRHEFGFLVHQNQKCVEGGFVLFKANCVASISSSQTNLGSEEIQTLNLDRPKTVRVRFKLHKECAFGQQFLVVGDDPNLGLWDPCDGVPLIWSEGHVWTAEVDVPCSKVINYKFILEEIDGAVSWQPGPDRVLETWDTAKMISVSEDWDVPDFQNIVEEEFVNDLSLNQTLVEEGNVVMEERVDLDSLGLLIAENWNGGVVEEGNGVMEERVDGNERRDDHSDEPSMVAENISEEQDLSMSGKTTLGDHDTMVMNGSESSSLKNETRLVIDEGVPVLVPGLATSPSKEVEVEETETEASSVVRTTTEVFVEIMDSTDINQRNNEIVEVTETESDGIEGSTDLKQRNTDVTTTVFDEIKDTPTTFDEIKYSTDLNQRNDIVEDTATASEETDLAQSNSDVTTTAFDENEDTSTTVDEIKDSTELDQRNNDVVEDTATASEETDLAQSNSDVTITAFDENEDTSTTVDEIKDSTELDQRNNDVVEDTATKSEVTDQKQRNNDVVEDTMTESDKSAAATKPEIHVSATLHRAETSEMRVEEEPRRNGKKQILDSDMQWGRKTLHRFLAKIGFMQQS